MYGGSRLVGTSRETKTVQMIEQAWPSLSNTVHRSFHTVILWINTGSIMAYSNTNSGAVYDAMVANYCLSPNKVSNVLLRVRLTTNFPP